MRGRGANLLLVGLATIVALGGAEGFLRAAHPQDLGIWRTLRDGMITLRPEIDVHLPGFGVEVRTNALGMRDREHEPHRMPSTRRILILGDSFMEALQVEFEDSFPHRLEVDLRRLAGDVEVVSAGVSGWGTDDQLAYLARRGVRLEPDLVLVAMTLHNDVVDNLELQFHDEQAGRVVPRPVEPVPLGEWIPLQIKGFLAAHSHLYRLTTQAIRSRGVGEKADTLSSRVADLLRAAPPEWVDGGWQRTLALLDALESEAAGTGARTAVFLIPLTMQLDDAAFADFVGAFGMRGSDAFLRAPQERMRAWSEHSGVPVIDLLPAFRAAREAGAALYLEGDGHWDAEGHALAARQVAQALARTDLLEGPGSGSR